jgi:hypothetical protein
MSETDHLHTSLDTLSASLTSLRSRLEKQPPHDLSGVVGFDGFVDTFIRMKNPASMAEFGPKVEAAAGIAASYAVDHQGDKFGGNGPLFAAALSDIFSGDTDLTYIGGIGDGEVEPIFAEALDGKASRLVPIAASAHSDCLEFTDGKIMLGDFTSCGDVTLDNLLAALGEDGLDDLVRKASYVSAVNWGKLPEVGEIWSHLAVRLNAVGHPPKSIPFFMDLAEFEHREEADVQDLLARMTMITSQCTSILSFNLKEAWQLGDRFGGIFSGKKDPESVIELAKLLRAHVDVDKIVIHPNSGAACATEDGAVFVPGPYCEEPLISTGAGDNFGAGCLAAVLSGCDDTEMLLMGNSTSGYFVRSGRTPDFSGLNQFLAAWSAGTLPERL